MNALIVGTRGVGKSTLIERVISELGSSVSGYRTKKESAAEDPEKGSPVYFYEIGKPALRQSENLLGYCKDCHAEPDAEAFGRAAQTLCAQEKRDLIVLDEIGVMETCSERFCAEILKILGGGIPVLAAVKHKDTPFLNAVRSQKNSRCFFITPENRDALYPEVLAFLREQL